jgi:hypothetical protein
MRADLTRLLEGGKQWSGDLAKMRYFYTLPFTNDIAGAMLNGKVNGYYYFPVNKKHFLAITPDPNAGVSEVHTVTLANTNTGGVYCFNWNGCFSNTLAYNATVSAMATALGAMDCFVRLGLSSSNFTCSATAAGSFTITINLQNAQVASLAEIAGPIKVVGNISSSSGTVFDTPSSVVTTYGRRGFSTNGTFCIDILAYSYRDVLSSPTQAKQYMSELNTEN